MHMNIPSKTQHLNAFEIEKLCHLLECDKQELLEFETLARNYLRCYDENPTKRT